MRIAVPTLGKKGFEEIVSDHFGRCDTYTIVNENREIIEIIENTSAHNGGIGLPPELLKKNAVDLLICKGIGFKALELCRNLNIEVYVVRGDTLSDVLNDWKNGKKNPASLNDVCKEHR